MESLSKMSNEKLTDLLAEKTNQYVKLLRANNKQEEFVACKKIIDLLTVEIKRRKEIQGRAGK